MDRTIYSLQYLRAIAAALVVIHHAREQIEGVRNLFESPFGSAGVDIFFVISGFIMMHVTSGKRPQPLTFFIHRLARVAPLYWIFTVALALLLIFAPSFFRSTSLSTDALLNSLFFLPYEWEDGRVRPLLSIGWTLNYEMFFYVVFSISLLFHKESIRLPFVAACLLLLICLSEIVSELLKIESTYLAHYGSTIILEFVAGMLISQIFSRGWFGNRVRGTIILVTGIGLFFLVSLSIPEDGRLRFLYFGLPAALLVSGCLDIESSKIRIKKSNFMSTLGDSSYSLYVSHIFALGVCRAAAHLIGLHIDSWLEAIVFLLACLIFCEIVGYLVYTTVERPMTRASKLLTSRLAAS